MSGRKIKPDSGRNALFNEKHQDKMRRKSNQNISYDENAIPVILYNRTKEKHWEDETADINDDVPDFIPPQRKLVLNPVVIKPVSEIPSVQELHETTIPEVAQSPVKDKMDLFTETKNQIVNRFTKLMQKIKAVFHHN